MKTNAGIGHNRKGDGSVYAIAFDLDTDTLKTLYHNTSWTNAYSDVKTFLTSRGFEWKQGGMYYGDDSITAVRCVRNVQRLSAKYPWFKPAVRDIRMLRIEENNDLMAAIGDEDD